MDFIRVFLIFLSLYFTVGRQALASTIVDPAEREQDISRDFRKEATGLHPKKEQKTLRFGYFSGEKQAEITLANTTDRPLSKLLYMDPLTGRLTLFEKLNGKETELKTAGSSIPFNHREVKSIFTAFKINLEPHSEKNFLLKIRSRHNFNTKVFLGNEQTLKAREDYKLSFLDFYLGGILCLIAYNFFIYVFLKDKNYLYYCFFSGSFVLPILSIHGVLDKILRPESFSFSHYLICFSALALFCATIFTFHFLEIKKHLPRFVLFYKICGSIAAFLILTGLTPLEDEAPQIFGQMIDLSLVIANLMFIVSAVKLRKVTNVARFYLFSWLVVFVSLLSWFGMTFGFLPSNFFTQHSLLYANLGQMLTLSLALAFRINELTKEKFAAEEKAMQKEKYHRLVRVLSHDIANSLTIIHAYSKKLIKPQNLEPQTQRIMEKVYFASENIKNILNNVREEELLSIRKKELGKELVCVQESIKNASVVFEDHLRVKKIALEIDVDPSHTIWANKTCFLNNIVNNILSNSIKFSFQNSRIKVQSVQDSDQICLTFIDYGRGVKQELINDIFFSNRFISSKGTNAEAGHGFGITLMREYVELFNGVIEVTSNENDSYSGKEGTKIILKFPLPSEGNETKSL